MIPHIDAVKFRRGVEDKYSKNFAAFLVICAVNLTEEFWRNCSLPQPPKDMHPTNRVSSYLVIAVLVLNLKKLWSDWDHSEDALPSNLMNETYMASIFDRTPLNLKVETLLTFLGREIG